MDPAERIDPAPITSLDDPRAITLLTTEHWSLLSARSLAYNEAFTRGGMFLSFLSMSFVGLALLAQALGFGRDFLSVAAIVLAFDLVIGVTTVGRIGGANVDDLRALHGIARIRHGYVQVAPVVAPYFTTATNDDVDSVLSAYGTADDTMLGTAWYALTTSAGMIGLITSMVGGLLLAILALLLLDVSGGVAIVVGIAGTLIVFLVTLFLVARSIPGHQGRLEVRFPAAAPVADPPESPETD